MAAHPGKPEEHAGNGPIAGCNATLARGALTKKDFFMTVTDESFIKAYGLQIKQEESR